MLKIHKGQVTVGNLVQILFVGLVLFIMVLPILDVVLADYIAGNPSLDPIVVALIGLIPMFLVIGYIITAYYYAVPRREAYQNAG